MPLVTIIIPVYNASGYLRKCLDSLMSQKFKQWECLLIDDGSIDDSVEICNEYVAQDARFIFYHHASNGVSGARNVGLNNAKGKYVCFVDSDDWIDECLLEEMAIAAVDADLVISGQTRVFPDGHLIILKPSVTRSFSINSECADAFIELERKLLLYAVHEKLYVNEIIRNYGIRFQEGCSYGEDLMFNYLYLEHVQSISTIAIAMYNYRIHDESLSSSFRPEQFKEDYAQWLMVKVFHRENSILNDDVEAFLAERLWGIVYDGIFLYPQLEEKSIKYLSDILSIPEIDLLKKHNTIFECAKWIKCLIINRQARLFFIYFKLFK